MGLQHSVDSKQSLYNVEKDRHNTMRAKYTLLDYVKPPSPLIRVYYEGNFVQGELKVYHNGSFVEAVLNL